AVGPRLQQVQDLAQALRALYAGTEDAMGLLTLERPTPLFTQSGAFRRFQVKTGWLAAGRAAGLTKSEAEGAFLGAEGMYYERDELLRAATTAAADAVLHGLCEELKQIGERYRSEERRG